MLESLIDFLLAFLLGSLATLLGWAVLSWLDLPAVFHFLWLGCCTLAGVATFFNLNRA